MKCPFCGEPVLELRGPSGRGMIVDEQAVDDGELAMFAGRLRRIVDGPTETDGPYISKHKAASLSRYREHKPRCTRVLKPKTVSERTTKPLRLVKRERPV